MILKIKYDWESKMRNDKVWTQKPPRLRFRQPVDKDKQIF